MKEVPPAGSRKPPRARPWLGALAVLFVCLWPAAAAGAAGLDDPVDQWLPRSDGAQWVYAWSNSTYSPTPRVERYHLQARRDTTFRLSWDEVPQNDFDTPASGTIDFEHTDAGLLNLNYQSTPPPAAFPILCATTRQCSNSVAGALFLLIWGSRTPVLAEPLLRRSRWGASGGADNDVVSDNQYVGRERVTVPAFPAGVEAAKVQSLIRQAGALGDPFGSGLRTVWWVRGVGPVKIELHHASGEVSRAELRSTSLAPLPLPSDVNLMPLNRGDRATFRWRNNRHMKRWSTQRFTVSQVVNGSAQVDVKQVSGPIAVAATYLIATRLSGVTLISGAAKAATRAKFPRLGPRGAAKADRRRFLTPFDLMVYGFNPILPVPAARGTTWRSSREGPDWKLFGVTGVSKVVGTRRVRTRAGRFKTTVVRSTLRQAGFRFGSGARTSYFAAGRGLVKLVFRHRDGSVSTVERVR
jgi:hypothetical protein